MNFPARTRNMRELTRVIFYESDTTTVRLLLASASLLYAIFLLINMALDQPTMSRPAYELMSIFGGKSRADYIWAATFFAHFAGVIWRLYDLRQCDVCSFIVNAYGFLIWFGSTLMLSLGGGFFDPGKVLEWTLSAASLWALWRTARVPEIASP